MSDLSVLKRKVRSVIRDLSKQNFTLKSRADKRTTDLPPLQFVADAIEKLEEAIR